MPTLCYTVLVIMVDIKLTKTLQVVKELKNIWWGRHLQISLSQTLINFKDSCGQSVVELQVLNTCS